MFVSSSVTGGGIAIGTTTNYPLYFGTNNVFPQLYLQNVTGNVGIGTTSPYTKLDVAGTYSTPGRVMLDDDGAANPRIRLFRWTGTAANYYQNTIQNTADGNAGNIAFQTGGATGAAIGSDTQTTKMTILQGGNVGIGTTSPAQKFNVKAESGYVAVNSIVQFFNPDWVSGTTGSSMAFRFGANSGNTYSEILGLNTGSNTWDNLILQSGGGKVGIGTTAPDVTLTVNGKTNLSGNVNITGQLYINNINNTAPDYVFEKGYNLTSLDNLKKYIEENKHLPHIKNSTLGVNVLEDRNNMLQTIEDNTLYILQLKDEIDTIKVENDNLKEALCEIKPELELCKTT
jgi:hypothetical protein